MRHGYKNEGKGAVETDGCFKQPHSRPFYEVQTAVCIAEVFGYDFTLLRSRD